MPTGLEDAIEIAVRAHRGQTDKAGRPYILHPLRVMLAQSSDPARIAAVLHDVVEDTEIELVDLKRMGFSLEVVEAVDGLTRRDGEDYDQFIRRAGRNSLARKIKLADLDDNLDRSRIEEIGPRDLARMEKYERAKAVLLALESK